MLQLAAREKKLAWVTAVVVAGSILYRLIIMPQIANISEFDARADAAGLEILQMERALALSERIEKKYKEYESFIQQKGTDLEEYSMFLQTVSNFTNIYQMETTDQLQPPVELGRYYKVFSLRLTVRTRPVWFARFLAALEESKELIRAEDLRVIALDDSENLSVSMKLTKVVAAEGKPL